MYKVKKEEAHMGTQVTNGQEKEEENPAKKVGKKKKTSFTRSTQSYLDCIF